jgi:aspartate racemase
MPPQPRIPHIGILAGMGPRSTAPFIDLLVAECQRQYGAQHDIDFPPMLIYSLPTPFYLDRPLDHAALAAAIQAGLQHLASTGVALIAMPCNSAHRYYAQLAQAIPVPLLNMVDEAVAVLPAHGSTIALLATRATLDAALYQPALVAAGCTLFHNEVVQQQIDTLIATIKAGALAEARRMWQNIVALLHAAQVDGALLACTDLNVVTQASQPPFAIIDATQQLAARTIQAWRQLET